MTIFIDVLDASGNKYGQPITTATGWTSTRRLDAAGTFSFSMPASDPRSAQLAQKRIVRAWSANENGVVELGAGIIESIVVQPTPKGPTMLTVSGDDLLRELVYRSVGDLALFDEADYEVDVLRLVTPGAPDQNLTLPASINLEPGPANFLIIGKGEVFDRVDFVVTSPNTTVANITVQYFNGTDQVSVDGLANTTVANGKPFNQSGSITFDIPGDWVDYDGDYQIRIYCDPENLGAFTLSDISVVIIEPIPDGLQRIMALAPPGWSLDAAGAYATERDVYMQFSGESVLTALVRLSEQTGEHFRLSASGRRIEWLGATITDSGLRAIVASEPSDQTLLITSLSQESETWEMYNRLYVYGGGSDGNARLTLANTTRSSSSGYTLSKQYSYIEKNTAQTVYGRIDHIETLPDIVPVNTSPSALIEAANALYDRAVVILRRAAQLQNAYSVSVIPSHNSIYPGQSLRIIYHEWTDGYHSVNIDAQLVVLEVEQQIGDSGIITAGLMVATVDTWPMNDSRAIARSLGDVQTKQAVKAPQTGFTSFGSGLPVAMTVENGMVISLQREQGLSDGVWPKTGGPGIDQLTLRNGVLIAINGSTS